MQKTNETLTRLEQFACAAMAAMGKHVSDIDMEPRDVAELAFDIAREMLALADAFREVDADVGDGPDSDYSDYG
jgi:hypothetical protein